MNLVEMLWAHLWSDPYWYAVCGAVVFAGVLAGWGFYKLAVIIFGLKDDE